MEHLKKFQEFMESIVPAWDGDLPGRGEDMASTHSEIMEKIAEIEELLEELNSY